MLAQLKAFPIQFELLDFLLLALISYHIGMNGRDRGSPSAFPAIYLGFTSFGEIFAYVTVFHPTIEVVTFRLRGRCMLGVYLLPAFYDMNVRIF